MAAMQTCMLLKIVCKLWGISNWIEVLACGKQAVTYTVDAECRYWGIPNRGKPVSAGYRGTALGLSSATRQKELKCDIAPSASRALAVQP